MITVCAVVVTRNRKQLLTECVTALLSQTHPLAQLIILDNASTDGTHESLQESGLLQSPILRFVRSEVNRGGAGGFAEGLAEALQAETDWIWLMDDDAEPDHDSLERLLTSPVAAVTSTAALCTSVVHGDRSIDPLHRCQIRRFITPLPTSSYVPGTFPQVDCASFVGLLLRTPVARTVSLPRREFFLGYDDAEYCLRIREQGDIRLVPDSVVTHKIAIGGGEVTFRSVMFNRLLGQHYAAGPWESYWKDLYRVRNFIALKNARQAVGSLELLVLIAGYVAKTLMYDNRPLRRIPWIVRYARKGRRGDFSGPTPEQWSRFAGIASGGGAPRGRRRAGPVE
ncbi:MAG: glycosyltransferase [Solirubrobacteraceae bacterium]